MALAAVEKHGAELRIEVVRRVLDHCERAGVDAPDGTWAALIVRHPELVRDRIPFADSPFAGAMLRLAALICDDGGGVLRERLRIWKDMSDTPEGRAVLAMAPELTRRVIPELAASLVRRDSAR